MLFLAGRSPGEVGAALQADGVPIAGPEQPGPAGETRPGRAVAVGGAWNHFFFGGLSIGGAALGGAGRRERAKAATATAARTAARLDVAMDERPA